MWCCEVCTKVTDNNNSPTEFEKMLTCKHDNGWSLIDNIHAYVYPNGEIEFDFTRRNKLLFTCNNTCGAKRNIYLEAKVKTWGKIKLTPHQRERKILSKLLVKSV